MSQTNLHDTLVQARQLLQLIPHVVIATTNDDGSPLATPVFGAFDDDLQFFWSSSPHSQHSRNIGRDGRVFAVLFDSKSGGGGLYIAGRATMVDDQALFAHGYDLLSRAKARHHATMAQRDSYADDGPQRLYRLTPEKFWICQPTKDDRGAIVRDQRVEITANDLRA